MQRATPTSTRSPSDSPPSRPGLSPWVAVEPGVDEERELDLRRGREDEQASRPDTLGATTGAPQGGRELGGPAWVTQSNLHIGAIGSRGPKEDYRFGWARLPFRTDLSCDPSCVVVATTTGPRL